MKLVRLHSNLYALSNCWLNYWADITSKKNSFFSWNLWLKWFFLNHSIFPSSWTITSLSVGVSFQVVITPSDHQQLVDWSSRYDIPVPLREDTVELLQRVVTLVVQVAALVPYDSSDDDDVETDDQYNWHVLDAAMRRYVILSKFS